MTRQSNDFDLQAVQDSIREAGFDGWLFAQFHGRDPLATRVLPGLREASGPRGREGSSAARLARRR
jgi:hypothetical protein